MHRLLLQGIHTEGLKYKIIQFDLYCPSMAYYITIIIKGIDFFKLTIINTTITLLDC